MTGLGTRKVDRDGAFSGNRPQRAIIDIGSNSVRMVLYGGSLRAPDTLFNEKVMARLGAGMKKGKLAPQSVALAMRGLMRWAQILADLGIADVDTVATAAVRDAVDGEAFLDQVRAIGLSPRVLSGEEEARLSARGVMGAFSGAIGAVADLGGGSLELVRIGDGEVARGVSLPLGSLRLPAYAEGTFDETVRRLAKVIRDAGWNEALPGPLYLVGGSWRALAVQALFQRRSVLTDPHGLELARKDARRLARKVAAMSPEALRRNPRLSSSRADSLPLTGPLLEALLDRLKPEQVAFSSWGLREGLLFDRLPYEQQAQDPLLAGISVFANMRGCPPTLATRVAGWTVDAMPPGWPGSERVRLAATSLALASMQVEPNLRIGLGIDWAMQKRWIGVTGEERALMAATIAANGNQCALPVQIASLARKERLEAAICWGLAIRLCRRLGGRSRASLQATRLTVEGTTLVLQIEQARGSLFGPPNEKDFALLAGRMGLKSELRLVGNPAGQAD
ncbi:MAG: Ppx/GppA family phosphatase [Sphingomonadaceae bacterium]